MHSRRQQVAQFYKPWDQYGALSNFTPHWIDMPAGSSQQSARGKQARPLEQWPTVEHYYQASKLKSAATTDPSAAALVQVAFAFHAVNTACQLTRNVTMLPQFWLHCCSGRPAYVDASHAILQTTSL